jgi:dimethylargininase
MLLALTRPVPSSITDCELTHLEREPIDWRRAVAQHDHYEDALRAAGCTVRRLGGDDTQPDSVFIEDAAVVFEECAVATRPGAESRRGEVPDVAAVLREYRSVLCIEPPGTLDGGDVLVLGRRVFVGLSSRTNEAGVSQLTRMLEPHGYVVLSTTVSGALHLKTAVTAIGDDRVVLNPAMVDGTTFDCPAIEIDPSEPMAANVLALGGVVLCSATAPRTRRLLDRHGYDTVAVDASELAKAEGGLTCCSLVFATT